MKPGIAVQSWMRVGGMKNGPVKVIVSINGPCTCTHILSQINQRGAKPLPEHYHLECQPLHGKRTQDTRTWHNYVLANGKQIGSEFYLEQVEDGDTTISKTETVELQLEMEF